jgi:hypothetical protein
MSVRIADSAPGPQTMGVRSTALGASSHQYANAAVLLNRSSNRIVVVVFVISDAPALNSTVAVADRTRWLLANR